MISTGFACRVPGKKTHLTFVINDPSRHNLMALLVNATSVKTFSERVCLLYKGEHEHITELSDIPYWGADLKHVTEIERELDLGRWYKVAPVSEEIVKRARDGIKLSKVFKPDYIPYL